MEKNDKQAIHILKTGNPAELECSVGSYLYVAVRIRTFITFDLTTTYETEQTVCLKPVKKYSSERGAEYYYTLIL